jgi:2-polyprenyl-3-methyl-5-hydroxy-6-metoxy-1,4-benzoquinol methylase
MMRMTRKELFAIINGEISQTISQERFYKHKFNRLKTELDKLKNEPVAIYGVGNHTVKLLDFIDFSKYNLVGLIDRDSNVTGESMFNNYQVYTIDSIIDQVNHIIISSISFQEEIYDRISWVKEKGINIIKIYQPDDFDIERIYLKDDEELGILRNVTLGCGLYTHLNRYLWVVPFCNNKNVLDIACGCGYGTGLLSEFSTFVTGVDIDPAAIEYASRHFNESNVDYYCSAVESFNPDLKYDVIVSFETIEHVSDESRYINRIISLLGDDGIFVVSTPVSVNEGQSQINCHHKNEFGEKRFVEFLQNKFNKVQVYVQDMENNGAIIFREAINDSLESVADNNLKYTIIAVCKGIR